MSDQPGRIVCLRECMVELSEAADGQAGCAPRVALEATHIDVLDYCALKDLQAHAAPRC